MRHPKDLFIKLKKKARKLFGKQKFLPYIVIFGVIGAAALLNTRAATPTAQFEAEAGSITGGARTIVDTSASAGQALLFSSPTVAPSGNGIWISPEELAALPINTPEWQQLLTSAESDIGSADISNQDSKHDVKTLGVALAAARTGRADLRTKAVNAVVSAINTEDDGRWLAAGRNLGSYIIAADLLNLRKTSDPNSDGSKVDAWLNSLWTKRLTHNNDATKTQLFKETAWSSGSNASAQEGFAYAALAVYTGNKTELDWSWTAYRRYIGDRTSSHTVTSNADDWQYIPSDPVGIMDAGAVKGGCRMDGAIGNDMSRGSETYSCTPVYTQYPWTGIDGSVAAALVLERAGYPAFESQQKAIKRAFDYLWELRTNTGEVRWFDGTKGVESIYVVNKQYNSNYLITGTSGNGRVVDWTNWTHAK